MNFDCWFHEVGSKECGIICEFKKRVRKIDRQLGYDVLGKLDYENAKRFMIVRHSSANKQTVEVSWHLTKKEAEILCQSQFIPREKYDFEGNLIYIRYSIEMMEPRRTKIELIGIGSDKSNQYLL